MPGINSPLIGASLTNVWKPLSTVGATSDKTAPFALGTRALSGDLVYGDAQFVRVSAGNIPNINGTTPIGVTNGVTAAAATGNNWYNKTGSTVAPVEGDYMFLVAGNATL
jgi:hypothetical protein